jgi:hypothetical protein
MAESPPTPTPTPTPKGDHNQTSSSPPLPPAVTGVSRMEKPVRHCLCQDLLWPRVWRLLGAVLGRRQCGLGGKAPTPTSGGASACGRCGLRWCFWPPVGLWPCRWATAWACKPRSVPTGGPGGVHLAVCMVDSGQCRGVARRTSCPRMPRHLLCRSWLSWI